MRLMAVTECRPGDMAADVVRGRHGTILATRGDRLTDEMIDGMRAHGLDVIPVEWAGWEGVSPQWWMPDEMIGPLERWAQAGIGALKGDGLIIARRIARGIIQQFPATVRRPFEWIPLYRCGNPALVAWLNTMGLTVKLTQSIDAKWVEDYALAAVLLSFELSIHEGHVAMPSDERMAELAGWVRPLSSIPATTRAALAQHHARWDGSGTPSLKGNEIYTGARILGLAELLNALLFRTDEPALPIHEALEWVVGGAGLDFPLDLIQILQRTVAPYPVGTVVQLGNGEAAVVLDTPHDWPSRPMIRVLNGQYRGHQFHLNSPDQHVRVITGFYNRRDLPTP